MLLPAMNVENELKNTLLLVQKGTFIMCIFIL